jgi:hypothetical protein
MTTQAELFAALERQGLSQATINAVLDDVFPDREPSERSELELLQAAVRDLFDIVTEYDHDPLPLPSAYISDLDAGLAANRAVEAGDRAVKVDDAQLVLPLDGE